MLRSLRARLIVALVAIVALALGASVAAMRHALFVTLQTSESLSERARERGVSTLAVATLQASVPELARALAAGADVVGLLERLHERTGCHLILARDDAREPLVVPEFPGARCSLSHEDGRLGVTVSRRSALGAVEEDRYIGAPASFPLNDPGDPGRWIGTLHALADPVFADAPAHPEIPRLAAEARALDRELVLVFLGAGVVIVGLVGITLLRVLRPVRALQSAAERLGAGDLGSRVAVSGDHELALLARAFNAMAERLERNERLRRDMVADVAHELRTPLTNLRCQIESVQDGLAILSPETIRSLHEEVLLLARVVDDLQVLTLADAGELSIARAPVDVAALLAQVAAVARPAFDAAKVALRVESEPELPTPIADETRLGQVLRNLLANARAHTPAGGTVTIRARALPAAPRGSWLELEVADTGGGIAAELLPRLFERFVRGEPSRSRATGGSGLGLAIVKSLVEAHGGRVVASSEPGHGARFTVTLPVAP